MENTKQNNPLKQYNATVNETKTDNSVKQIPLLENVRKFKYFDYTKGKKFSTTLLLKLVIWFFGLQGLSIPIILLLTLGKIDIIQVVLFIFSLWFISLTFQKAEVGCDGITIVNLKYGFPYKTFIKWEDIENITFEKNTVKGTTYYTRIITVAGKKENVNLTAMNESNEMVHNLILAYFNYSRNKNFDWSQVII